MDAAKPAQVKNEKLTAELVALIERLEPDPGPEPGTTDHTDAEFDAMVKAVLAEYSPDELWVFAYGSLIWNPEFKFVESRRATAHGWHRSFCLKLTRWRGTRELPALMLALDGGGTCKGVALVLIHGGRYIGSQAGIGIAVDFVWVVLFSWFLIRTKSWLKKENN